MVKHPDAGAWRPGPDQNDGEKGVLGQVGVWMEYKLAPGRTAAVMLPPGEDTASNASGEDTRVTEESTLIRQTQAGNMDAFERLYRQHVNRIHALCLRMTGNRMDAEDRTQEVFVKAWEKITTFEGKSSFYSWLHRIAVNLLITEHRKRSRKDSHEVAVGDDVATLSAGTRDHSRQRLDLESAVARLPEGARIAFVLHDVEGFKHHEIASLTGMATGTSKAQVHRARKLLREMLA